MGAVVIAGCSWTALAPSPATTPVAQASRVAAPVDTTEDVPAPPAIDLTKSKISAIGDSVLLGAGPTVKRQLPNMLIDAKVSRQSTEMFSIIRDMRSSNTLAPVVIIHCGTNGPTPDKDLRSILSSLSDRTRVVIVTTHMDTSWMDENNTTLRRVAKDYPNVRLADWALASQDHPGYFVSDGVHPTTSGAKVFANTIAEALKAA
ncbi:MAG: hypothetical protein WCI74_09550 [Actinomycetes bacterium]